MENISLSQVIAPSAAGGASALESVSKLPVTVVILTKNEELLIRRCISSVPWAAEILVVDSGSTDRTVEIAEMLGAKTVFQEWLGWSPQRNAGAALAANDWVLVLEADEIVTDELADSIHRIFEKGTPNPNDGYALNRRGDFLGILLPNPSRPSKRKAFVRIYNRTKSLYDVDVLVHEEVVVPGERYEIPGILLHWRGMMMDDYAVTFNRYATLEAQNMANHGLVVKPHDLVIKPVARFGWNYFVKGGIKHGTRGFIEAWLKSMNEFLKYAKLWEAQNQGKEPHPPESYYPRSRYLP